MSKKKGKPQKRAPKKAATKRTGAAAPRQTAGVESTGTTSQITIFLYRTGNGNRIRTAPQRAYAGPGHVEWTVVNLIDGSDVPVTITWPNGGPWGREAIAIRSSLRESAEGAKPGVYKYVVSALDAQEDPEIEFPQN
ncbi:MAG TPA: hypothetical protein VM096_11225 [Vicinamibacterales bacterium]|nr:hypothetical protein [Vicinamibacterales bacterium]